MLVLLGHFDTVSAGPLGVVKSVVRSLEGMIHALSYGPTLGDTQADRTADGSIRCRGHDVFQSQPNSLSEDVGSIKGNLREKNSELLASEPTEDVFRPQQFLGLFHQGTEDTVADGMPEIVVDGLEVVDVEHHQ